MESELNKFTQFIRATLASSQTEDVINRLTLPDSITIFRRAFTNGTFIDELASKDGVFDYEVFEKVGDKAFGMFFQLWLYSIIGQEVTIPQVYADASKKFEATDHMAFMATQLGFDAHIRVAKGMTVTNAMKEDVFESFVAALIFAGDKFVMPDIGIVLAKKFAFKVLNETTRKLIDPSKSSELIDARTQIKEIFDFNGWGKAKYVVSNIQQANANRITFGVTPVTKGAKADLIAPDGGNVPDSIRGKLLGSGTGPDDDTARENAAKNALSNIEANFSQFIDNEAVFTSLGTSRLTRELKNHPDLIKRIEALLQAKPKYQAIAIRNTKVLGIYYIQVRVKINGIFRNGIKDKSNKNEDDAIVKALNKFLKKAESGDLDKALSRPKR